MSRSFIVDSRPAIAKLWPSRNSIVVRASRLVSDGTVKPEIWIGLREVELAHRRRQTQIDDAVSQNRRHERQLHAEGLVVDGDDRHAAGAPRLHDRYRKFAARQEGGSVTGECNQVRLGQTADEALRFQCGQSNIEAGPLGGETGQRDAKGRAPEIKVAAVVNIGRPGAPLPAGEPGAGTGFPLASTPVSVQGRACPGVTAPTPVVKASVPPVVCPKPIHPDFAARAAGDLKKSDPEHHLLRRGDFHRIHDAAAFGHHGLGHLHGAVGGHRIAGEAAEHDLAVAAANADGAAAGARTNLFLEIAGVQGDLHVDHADQLHALIEYRNVGGPNLLALNVQPIDPTSAVRRRYRANPRPRWRTAFRAIRVRDL